MLRFGIPAILAAVLLMIPNTHRDSIASGCAAVPPRGSHVDIASESAIILWDAASKTEHFIRRASFRTAAKDFGFLVPTPSKPTLAEADDSAFHELQRITAPPVRVQSQSSGGCSIGCSDKKMAMAPANSVEVLEEKRVAGYDATVLAATDAAALNKWLGEHGYESSEALKTWLEPYIAKGWIITAYKVAAPAESSQKEANSKTTVTAGKGKAPEMAAGSTAVQTSAVRMSFKTEKPFYPYREPEDQRLPNAQKVPRMLRVYFVSTEKVEGTLGENSGWPGKVRWSKTIQDGERLALIRTLKLDNETTPATWWLTEFEDRSSPRPGIDEVFFRTATDQNPVERGAITYPNQPNPPWWILFALFAAAIASAYLRRMLRSRPVFRFRPA